MQTKKYCKMMHDMNLEQAKNAVTAIDEIRNSSVFDKGKSSVEIIREWRDRRR
ncbi:hypothetical protein HYU06_06440 [Candidatus Woesearchaeota archaeon]|nr:hypothetical protein [Candidatus Woesearchaeota archaeon]